jgi:hypothetical protein
MKTVLFAILILFSISCKKESVSNPPPPPPPGNPNNKLEADVFVHKNDFHLSSAGNNTSFAKQDFNFTARYLDSVLMIQGAVLLMNGDYDKGIQLFLTNIKDTGTYSFGRLDSGRNIEILYTEAGVYPYPGPTYLANSDQDSGELIVETFSDKHIEGTFKANGASVYYCCNTAEITKGRFSMDF